MTKKPFATAHLALAAASVLAVLGIAPPVAAQQQTFHLDRLEVPGAPDDGLVVFRPVVQESAIVYGQLGLGLAVDPLRTSNMAPASIQAASATNVITHQLSTYASAGVEFLNRFTFGITFPAAWIEGGNQPGKQAMFLPPAAITAFSTNGPAIGDARLDFRGVAWRSQDSRWAVGAQLSMMIPTGTTDNFGGDGSASWLPMVNGQWVPPGLALPLTFVANLGVHFRPGNAVNDPAGHFGGTGLGVSNELRWAIGALMPVGDRFRIGATIFGQTGLTAADDTAVGRTFFTSQNTPIEWNAEGRMKWPLLGMEHFFVGAGLGTRLTDGYGGPDFRLVALAGTYWPIEDANPPAPDHRLRGSIHESLKDTDGDGIPDDVDACPTVPEDHKDPDPSDGCPAPLAQPDTDKDGIPDAKDACPREPGEPDPDPSKNGCPKHIRLEGSNVRILQQVHFQTASATILPDSFPMLTEMTKLLKANPEIKRLRIEGHTDNRGGAEYNLDLSKKRAASVRTWLVQRGVEGERLESEGYGLTRPLAANDSDEGRAQNRRVEFKILEESSGGGGSGGP